jgi:hypothetical protein
MRTFLATLAQDERGTTTIEFTLVALMFFTFTFGMVEFSYMFWQYNSASKAVQVGARLAAVSDPVWTDLTSLTDDSGTPGGPWTLDYEIVCSGEDEECDGDDGTYDAAALERLVEGRDGVCGDVGDDRDPGMCDIFDRVTPENVIVTYSNTGLGFAGRPGGPVPTITVQLTGLTFEFVGLGDLLGLDAFTMPDFLVTMTGEDLSALAP